MRGLGGEHTPIGADGTVDISPSARYCITEAEIITALCVTCDLVPCLPTLPTVPPVIPCARVPGTLLTRFCCATWGGGAFTSGTHCRVGRYKGIEQLKAAEDKA